MLKKLDFYYDTEDHEKIDISDEKIYWDTQKNQFRHRIKCRECGEDLGCRCYDSIDTVFEECSFLCDSCGIDLTLSDFCTEELIWQLDAESQAKVEEFKRDKALTDEDDQVRDYVISLMTEEKKKELWYNSCDPGSGDSCEI